MSSPSISDYGIMGAINDLLILDGVQSNIMEEKQYVVKQCVRLGEAPLFLVFYSEKRRPHTESVLLCTYRKFHELKRQKGLFSNPLSYGHMVYSNLHGQPTEALAAMLKSRYDFNLPNSAESA